MPGNCKHPLATEEWRGPEITHNFLRKHPVSLSAARTNMAPPRVPLASATAPSKKGTQAGAAAEEDFPPFTHRAHSPIQSPAIPFTDTQLNTECRGNEWPHRGLPKGYGLRSAH